MDPNLSHTSLDDGKENILNKECLEIEYLGSIKTWDKKISFSAIKGLIFQHTIPFSVKTLSLIQSSYLPNKR